MKANFRKNQRELGKSLKNIDFDLKGNIESNVNVVGESAIIYYRKDTPDLNYSWTETINFETENDEILVSSNNVSDVKVYKSNYIVHIELDWKKLNYTINCYDNKNNKISIYNIKLNGNEKITNNNSLDGSKLFIVMYEEKNLKYFKIDFDKEILTEITDKNTDDFKELLDNLSFLKYEKL